MSIIVVCPILFPPLQQSQCIPTLETIPSYLHHQKCLKISKSYQLYCSDATISNPNKHKCPILFPEFSFLLSIPSELLFLSQTFKILSCCTNHHFEYHLQHNLLHTLKMFLCHIFIPRFLTTF